MTAADSGESPIGCRDNFAWIVSTVVNSEQFVIIGRCGFDSQPLAVRIKRHAVARSLCLGACLVISSICRVLGSA